MNKLDVLSRIEKIGKIDHSRSHIYTPKDVASKAADIITGFVGSWLFVGLHSLWFILWITLRIEAFPFGLLTLLVSLEAIFLSTFVMMSQNRAAERDHVRDDHEAQEVDVLYQINQTQLEILEMLRKGINPEKGGEPAASPPASAASGPITPERKVVKTAPASQVSATRRRRR